jgi:hypothetical protein
LGIDVLVFCCILLVAVITIARFSRLFADPIVAKATFILESFEKLLFAFGRCFIVALGNALLAAFGFDNRVGVFVVEQVVQAVCPKSTMLVMSYDAQ